MLLSTPLPRRLRGLLRHKSTRKILHALYKDANAQKWVFVTGCYNSGTTLLAHILEADSRINTLPGEGVRYTSELTRPEDIGWTRMWSKCLDYVQMPAVKQPDKARLLKSDWSAFYSRGGHINLEKSIVTVPRMPWINANFENVYFVGIVRCPYAVSKGILRRAKPIHPLNEPTLAEYTLEMATSQWVIANEILCKHTSELPNTKIVTYEDLVAQPVQTIESIYQSIEEPPPKLTYQPGKLSVNDKPLTINEGENSKRLGSLSDSDRTIISNVVLQSSVQSMLATHGIKNYVDTEAGSDVARNPV